MWTLNKPISVSREKLPFVLGPFPAPIYLDFFESSFLVLPNV